MARWEKGIKVELLVEWEVRAVVIRVIRKDKVEGRVKGKEGKKEKRAKDMEIKGTGSEKVVPYMI